MKKTFLTLSFLLFCFPLSHSQDYDVTVTAIRVWVALEGAKSAPLTEKDFEIFEDGKKMEPTCFEPPAASGATQTTESSNKSTDPLPRKRVAILVDQLNTSQSEFLFIHRKIEAFLEQVEGKSEVMLAALPPYEELVPFTNNFYEIRSKLERLSGNRERDQRIAHTRRDIRDAIQARKMGVAYNIASQAQMEEKQEVALTFDSLKTFQSYLAKQEQQDHTAVILISGGLNSHPGQQYVDMLQNVLGGDEGLRSLDRGRQDFKRTLKEVLGRLNRANVTVYTINTRGQIDVVDNINESDRRYMSDSDDYAKDYQELLEQIARDTGGIAFQGSLNFKKGFDAILDDLAQQYLICYVAPEHKEEGKYHEIKVVSKAKGAKVRHRSGYVD